MATPDEYSFCYGSEGYIMDTLLGTTPEKDTDLEASNNFLHTAAKGSGEYPGTTLDTFNSSRGTRPPTTGSRNGTTQPPRHSRNASANEKPQFGRRAQSPPKYAGAADVELEPVTRRGPRRPTNLVGGTVQRSGDLRMSEDTHLPPIRGSNTPSHRASLPGEPPRTNTATGTVPTRVAQSSPQFTKNNQPHGATKNEAVVSVMDVNAISKKATTQHDRVVSSVPSRTNVTVATPNAGPGLETLVTGLHKDGGTGWVRQQVQRLDGYAEGVSASSATAPPREARQWNRKNSDNQQQQPNPNLPATNALAHHQGGSSNDAKPRHAAAPPTATPNSSLKGNRIVGQQVGAKPLTVELDPVVLKHPGTKINGAPKPAAKNNNIGHSNKSPSPLKMGYWDTDYEVGGLSDVMSSSPKNIFTTPTVPFEQASKTTTPPTTTTTTTATRRTDTATQPGPQPSKQARGGHNVPRLPERPFTVKKYVNSKHSTPASTSETSPTLTRSMSETVITRAALEVWQRVQVLSWNPKPLVSTKVSENAQQRYRFDQKGCAPAEMAGEAIEMNYEIHNVLAQLRHKNRKVQLLYPEKLPVELDLRVRGRRPRTPRSFYGKKFPHVGDVWFRGALKDARYTGSPDLSELERQEAEEKRRNPKAGKGVGQAHVNADHKPLENDIGKINEGALRVEAACK